MKTIFRKFLGSSNDRQLKKLLPLVQEVDSFEPQLEKLSEEELKGKTPEFRQRLERGESLDNLMPEAFAVVREASKRSLGMRHFDVQIMGGSVLHQGTIAEMKTGEGKTLCATLPIYLNALAGKGVHLVTVNDYLAKRDAEWMGILYSYLGLSTGVVVNSMSQAERLHAYRCDITYGQNNEFGFDYLRDNMKISLDERGQRDHYFAIVDEVDSILIDEARTPLIISGPSEDSTDKYVKLDKAIRHLKAETHYTVDEKAKQASFTDEGVEKVEKLLTIENLYDPQNIELVHHANNALSAHVTKRRDIDYVVTNGEVIIVDEFTGRQMPGRRWSDGLHQAIEAKENVKIANESQTLASITFQNYFRMYEKLAGMTGTADTEAVEFKKIYDLEVVVIPTNKPMKREDYADVVFASEKGKYSSACDEIADCHKRGQPVLVGTANIDRSEYLSHLLQKREVPHTVLNAKHHEREADIVAQAGRLGSVTISTNMAGRGTDILLGGNPTFLALEEVGDIVNEENQEHYDNLVEQYSKQCEVEKQQVLDSGGLHILGTERHESRRIDNQLRGRSGRQGDPGSSRFYVSLEDELMRRFGGAKMQLFMQKFGFGEDDAIEGSLVAKSIENAQKKVEGRNFDIRKHLLEYDDVMNKQREVIYELRDKFIKAESLKDEVLKMIDDVVENIIVSRADERDNVENWNTDGMFETYRKLTGIELPKEELLEKGGETQTELAQVLFETMKEEAREKYLQRRVSLGEKNMEHFERIVLIQSVDQHWKEHLAALDSLKEGIGLRGFGQRNPLHEYQREAFELFSSMMIDTTAEALQQLFLVRLLSEEEMRELEEREKQKQKKLEEQAKAIHNDSNGEEKEGSNLNRRQRRKASKNSTKENSAIDVGDVARKKKVSRRSRRRARR